MWVRKMTLDLRMLAGRSGAMAPRRLFERKVFSQAAETVRSREMHSWRRSLRALSTKLVGQEEHGKDWVVVTETKWMDQPFSARCFDIFKLLNFNKHELAKAFDQLDSNQNGLVERDEVKAFLRVGCRRDDLEASMSEKDIEIFSDEFMKRFGGKDKLIDREQFEKVILKMANRVDRRVWPITFSMVCTGTAIGVIIPVMPLFVKTMGLSSSEYGMVVSSFALSKLLGNIPCAFLSDKHGRKPIMTVGLSLIAVGMAGIGFVDSLEGLMACRLISGLGASAFTTASMLYLMDIGTPFTRTKTMAPISAGFSAGAAVGPAIGGFLAGMIGIEYTFMIVGGAFAALTVANYRSLSETRKVKAKVGNKNPSLREELRETFKQWKPLLQDGKFRSTLGMNVMYWLALSGSYMTLLPMILVQEDLGLTPAQVGGVFAMTSAVNVVCTQPAAWIADKYGKPQAILISSLIVSGAMYSFPLAPELTPALGILGLWSLGGTIFGMAPTAYVTDIVKPNHRSQALALLRTTGDIGLLVGASVTGLIADHSSKTMAMQSNSVALLGTAIWFAAMTRGAHVESLSAMDAEKKTIKKEEQEKEQRKQQNESMHR